MTATLLPTHRHYGSLAKETDLDKERLLALVGRAARLKRDRAAGTERQHLAGRGIVLVLDRPSTRTRCAFEVAAHDQGAHVTCLGPESTRPGRDESARDTARVLGRMFHGIGYAGRAQESVEELADHAGVPVWNVGTDSWHPTRALAEVLTMTEHHRGPPEEIVSCFTGDAGGAAARSLLVTGALLGMDVRVAAPRALWPAEEVVATARRLAVASGARVLVTEDPEAGVAGADFVHTDAWLSMGESEEQWRARVSLLLPYRVTERLLLASGRPATKFLHRLPAVHDAGTRLGKRLHDRHGLVGAEVTDEVFASPRSVVFDQAENRLHTVKAVLVAALGR